MSELVVVAPPGASVRESAKNERRLRILDAARDILRETGHQELSIRTLAARADVTTPTIYNLIGSKQEVLLALSDKTLTELELAHHVSTTVDPIEKAEEVINGTVAIYQRDEIYTRQLQLGLEAESLDDFDRSLRHRGKKVAIEDCKKALDLGYLRGQIDSELLGNRFALGFQQAQRAWLRGEFDLEGMRKEALISCFIILAADAKPKFHKRLIEAIRHFQA
jgi:AcrR family transcriptional regulator